MPYDHREPYVTDLGSHRGPVDRISPYHFYQYAYWNLRGYWRRQLYAWMRRSPCDATATLEPAQVVAGEKRTLALTVTLGPTPLRAGGRIAVYCQKDFGGVASASTLCRSAFKTSGQCKNGLE